MDKAFFFLGEPFKPEHTSLLTTELHLVLLGQLQPRSLKTVKNYRQ